MKNSIGNDRTKLTRAHSMVNLATLAASGGMAVPWVALASVQRIIFFCMRQMMPQTFSSMNQPRPPPMPMASPRLLSQPLWLRARKAYDAPMTAMATITPSTGPFRNPLAGDMSTPISMANASVQSTKKLPNIIPGDTGSPATLAYRASLANNVHPVGDAGQHGYKGAPAKPPQSTRHELGNHNSAQLGI